MRLIDADALINALDDRDNWLGQMELEHMAGINIYSMINSMPTVEERPKGKWRLIDKEKFVSYYNCSICGRGVIADNGDIMAEDFPFCHCGADMREGEEE